MLKNENSTDYRKLLTATKTIAMVGLSPKEERPSNLVARYLIATGYQVIPVNPGQERILGLRCYAQLHDIDQPVDMVDIFRKSETVFPLVREAVEIGARSIWMQQGVVHQEAAAFARENGLVVVMDRCVKIEHMRLFPANG
ncbi:MAG: CoA-binding protein [Desulfopila sp.]